MSTSIAAAFRSALAVGEERRVPFTAIAMADIYSPDWN
jgi:hypothetical protein